MVKNESVARKSVLSACVKLCDLGLVERTWGNVSARLDDEYFLITPSGRSYDNLSENELVKVRISDLKYEGDILPSSEKGVHAAIYAARKDVGFIVHTHQSAATVVSIAGNDLNTADFSALGGVTPCAEYALPSTIELAESVRDAVVHSSGCNAALMRHHGVVCFGKDSEECFEAALALEELCRDILSAVPVTMQLCTPLGSSIKSGNAFKLRDCDEDGEYPIECNCSSEKAKLHRQIYTNTDAQFIMHCSSSAVLNAARMFERVPAYVDDFTQIIGEDIMRVESCDVIASKLQNRNAVLIKDFGAMCFGKSEDDCKAAASILEKNCLAALYAECIGGCTPISPEHSKYLRDFYVNTYEKRK